MKHWTTKSGNKVFEVLGGRSNVFLVQYQSLNLLVDTSSSRHIKRLISRLKQLSVQKIDYLILTHTHYDHSANAAAISKLYGAKIIVHGSEAQYLLQGKNILPQGTNRVTRFLIHRFGERYLHHFNYQPCTPDVLIKHRYYIAETNNHIELMHTPGHTKGCLSVIVDNELAIVGDAMFGVFPGSIFPPYGNDVRQMVESWEKLLETSCRLFIPAHGSANKRDLVQKCYSRRKQKTI